MDSTTHALGLVMEDAPMRATIAAQWWPDLFLRRGRNFLQITPEQCAALREVYNAGRGASECGPDIKLYDNTGACIGRVSYNGRVWLHDIEGDIEIPQARRKTAAQRDAEGWR